MFCFSRHVLILLTFCLDFSKRKLTRGDKSCVTENDTAFEHWKSVESLEIMADASSSRLPLNLHYIKGLYEAVEITSLHGRIRPCLDIRRVLDCVVRHLCNLKHDSHNWIGLFDSVKYREVSGWSQFCQLYCDKISDEEYSTWRSSFGYLNPNESRKWSIADLLPEIFDNPDWKCLTAALAIKVAGKIKQKGI